MNSKRYKKAINNSNIKNENKEAVKDSFFKCFLFKIDSDGRCSYVLTFHQKKEKSLSAYISLSISCLRWSYTHFLAR